MGRDADFASDVEELLDVHGYWRGKERLAGRLTGPTLDPRALEEYGRLLLRHEEDYEAGRFLFASGARHPDYEGVIGTFLARQGGSRNALWGAMPRLIRRAGPDVKRMIADPMFRDTGFPEDWAPAPPTDKRAGLLPEPLWVRIVIVSVLIAIPVLTLIGLGTILMWIVRFIW